LIFDVVQQLFTDIEYDIVKTQKIDRILEGYNTLPKLEVMIKNSHSIEKNCTDFDLARGRQCLSKHRIEQNKARGPT
jgi:hypothetical protein